MLQAAWDACLFRVLQSKPQAQGFSPSSLVVHHDILVDEVSDVKAVQVRIVEGKVERLRAAGLVTWVVKGGHIRVAEGLLDRDSLVRVELEHPVDQIQRLGVGVRVVPAE